MLWCMVLLWVQKFFLMDEVCMVMGVFDEIFFIIVLYVYCCIDDVLCGEEFGVSVLVVFVFVWIGLWVGGDCDGNLFVMVLVICEVFQIVVDYVLCGFEWVLECIGWMFIFVVDDILFSVEVIVLWDWYVVVEFEFVVEFVMCFFDEFYWCVLLILVWCVVVIRYGDGVQGYVCLEELFVDFCVVQVLFVVVGVKCYVFGGVQYFIWQVEIYGFYFIEFEVCQYFQVYVKVLVEFDVGEVISVQIEEVLEVFCVIVDIQCDCGLCVVGCYVVFFMQVVFDFVNVYCFVCYVFGDDVLVFDVVLLFEMFVDLQVVFGIFVEVVIFLQFCECMVVIGNCFEVMLGYFDFLKDVGFVVVNLVLYEVQEKIVCWVQELGIELILFYGCGGVFGCGGGFVNFVIFVQLLYLVDGWFKFIEQGEVIFVCYGEFVIVMWYIDQVVVVILFVFLLLVEECISCVVECYVEVVVIMDVVLWECFFLFVKVEGFVLWFVMVMLMEEIGLFVFGFCFVWCGLLVELLEDLWVILWVFVWIQVCINFVGWFGFGLVLDVVGDVDMFFEVYCEWLLLCIMIDNVVMSFVKIDECIVCQYFVFGDCDDFVQFVFDEFVIIWCWVICFMGGEGLLENKLILQCVVQLCSLYVDVFFLLQLCVLCVLWLVLEGFIGFGVDVEQQCLFLFFVSGVVVGLQNIG